MDQEKIGNYIKKLRIEKGLSQKDLADELGVTFQAVSKWENGKNLPDMQILSSISKYFNVDIDSIIFSKKTSKKVPRFILFLLIFILFMSCFLLIYSITKLNKNDTYQYHHVKELKSKNTNYNLYGSIIQYDEYSTFVLNNISYKGSKDSIIYKNITCDLYKETDNKKEKLMECSSKSYITIDKYFETFKIKYDSYEKLCPDYNRVKYLLEIKTIDNNDNSVIYQVPIEVDDV